MAVPTDATLRQIQRDQIDSAMRKLRLAEALTFSAGGALRAVTVLEQASDDVAAAALAAETLAERGSAALLDGPLPWRIYYGARRPDGAAYTGSVEPEAKSPREALGLARSWARAEFPRGTRFAFSAATPVDAPG